MTTSKLFLEQQFVNEPDATLQLLNEKAMVGQKRTSLSKAIVYLLPESPTFVYKGPYLWPQKAAMIAQTMFRCELFERVWKGCETSGPVQLLRFSDGQVFFKLRHICANDQIASKPSWNGSLERILGEEQLKTVASKESQGLVELSEYLAQPTSFQQDSVLTDALIHFMHRYICDPIVGDAALRNVLVCVKESIHFAVGIDFEENRTGDEEKRKEEQSRGLFGMICGGKLWNKNAINLLEAALVKNKERVVNHLQSVVGSSWCTVETLIAKHCLSKEISVEKMKMRCNLLIDAINSVKESRKRKQIDQ